MFQSDSEGIQIEYSVNQKQERDDTKGNEGYSKIEELHDTNPCLLAEITRQGRFQILWNSYQSKLLTIQSN
jgi:hypothetical protein